MSDWDDDECDEDFGELDFNSSAPRRKTTTHKTDECSFDSIEHETPMAYLLKFGDKDIWIPKSMCTLEGHVAHIRTWFLEKNYLEHIVD